MLRVTKEFHFCAAHRLNDYEGKCSSLHGHNYRVLLSLGGAVREGMIVDFGNVNKDFTPSIDALDHSTIISKHDEIFFPAIAELKSRGVLGKVFIMDEKVTAENIAYLLYKAADVIFGGVNGVFVYSVTVYETDTCFATYER